MYKKQFLQAQTTTEFWSTFIDKLHKLTSPKDFNLWAKYAYDISISRTKQIRHPSKVNKVLKSTSCHNSLNDQIRRSQIIQAIGHFPGKLLNGACFYELTNYFPGSIRFCKPTLVFKMEDNGTSILTMLEHMNSNCSYLLILKTSSGVFGAYLSDPPSKRKERGRFFGNATTFVFSMNPLLVYPGRSSDSISGGFISIDKNSVMIGKPNPAIYFEDQFRMVMSNYCECFHSPAFTPADGADIYDIEIYKLDVGMKRQRSMTFSHEAFIVEN
ncbi:TLD family protein [Histomonas meleagridis]|uniref:TLD family protein n=1 Tax=Histomonas meleagridis TaxID=135588 RepID=UPI003559E6FC|nr:TLD family protein [Histomonas meleagridis]KAH0804770.1 TLD family protein [Histomonas meleagridis]